MASRKASTTKVSGLRSPARRAISTRRSGVRNAPPAPLTGPRVATIRAAGHRRKLDAVPDRMDIRDWMFQPRLTPLPDILINCDSVPEILDQGSEGACTGFALAAVVNFLLHTRNVDRRVSERMLYEMARRYDEWPGEAYEGSSARGAMKGWVAHGVCRRDSWPNGQHGVDHFDEQIAREAIGTPGGAYYRVSHRQVRDMHAALQEAGILYATLMVHDGWFDPSGAGREYTYVENGNLHTRTFPVIERKGRADAGHAIAIVGYTQHGFIVQNSWGQNWGEGGFALLPYEDYMLHATDVWVAQLGVPVLADLWKLGGVGADTTAGLHRATPSIPLTDIRPYVIDLGNNGELSGSGKYWTTEADLERLFKQTIPDKTADWPKKRVLLYLHGGLNDEEAVARRIVAFRDVCLENQIYPLHIMWETGWKETLDDIVKDRLGVSEARAGNWLDTLRGGLDEARDWSFEHTVALPGTALWDEMKENARLASGHDDGIGGVQLLTKHVKAAFAGRGDAERRAWEVHLVGHSAGSIFAAHALPLLLGTGVTFKTLQFMAPAMTVDLFKETMLTLIERGKAPQPTLYILGDEAERRDTVWIYGKSLLYLVSNAFERKRGTPLLGMQRFVQDVDGAAPDPKIARLFAKDVGGQPSLVLAGRSGDGASRSSSTSHGGFDNDADTLNSVLRRILGLGGAAKLARAFDQDRDLSFD